MVHALGQLSLISGWLPVVILVLGALALGWLLRRRERRHLLRTVPVVVATALLLTIALRYVVENIWRPFPDALPLPIYARSALACSGCSWPGPGCGTRSAGAAGA